MAIKLLNIDCMEYMKTLPDKAFDLAIVDPPYGMDRKMDGTGGAGRIMRKWKRAECWDIAPDAEYWTALFRVSKNQIVWGANNFMPYLPATTNFVFWDKHQPAPNFADGELAWTSFKGVCKKLDLPCFGAHGQDVGGKQHPTQKPVKLYEWLLQNYAKPGDRILDTHLGSGSSAIAAHYGGFDFVGCELDKDYYDAACRRFEQATAQLSFYNNNEVKLYQSRLPCSRISSSKVACGTALPVFLSSFPARCKFPRCSIPANLLDGESTIPVTGFFRSSLRDPRR